MANENVDDAEPKEQGNMDRKDPESTRCTYFIALDHAELFNTATPGDRIEMHEERDEQPTGRVLTARVLDVRRTRVG